MMNLIRFTQVFILATLCSVASAQFDVSWFTVDGGGRIPITGGTFSASGTIGQPDAGPVNGPMVGGSFSLRGGFWPATVPACSCPGDMNGDSLKNGKDIQQFVGCIISGGNCDCADVDFGNGVSLADVPVFVNSLLSGSACL